jgi:predicted nuclease of predicted toxin-antitoxin system
MKFLLDVNASGPLAVWLKDLGYNVAEVRHRDPRMKDDDIT